MTRKITFQAGHYYHLYNRGVNRQPIFLNEDNWAYFIKQLRQYALPELLDIVAYCLMPNHYHLLVYLKTDELSAEVMQPFGVSYTKAVNKQQGRVGPLFQGRFQALEVDKEGYLLDLSCYIHLNPVRARLVKQPEDWVYSSYRDYVGLRKGTLPNPEIVLVQFASRQAYAEWVAERIALDEEQKQLAHLMLD